MVLKSLQQCSMALRLRPSPDPAEAEFCNVTCYKVHKLTHALLSYLILLVSYQCHHHVLTLVVGVQSQPLGCNSIHHLLLFKPVLARRLSRIQGTAKPISS